MPLDPSVLSPGLEDAAPRKKRASLDLDSYLEAEGASHLKPVVEAIYGQESGSGRTNATSVDGARGGMQVIPATFNRLARDGERIDNPDDNMRVGIRYIKQLGDRFGNDPARIAAGYFSGEGNVATSGDTPYKADRADGNGKRVSSYVQDVLGRIGNSVIPSAQAEEAKSRPASMGNRLDQLESLRDGGTRPSDRLSQLSSLQDAPQEDASASKPNDTSLLDPIKKWWNGPGSVMDGYQTDPQEASRNVIGMTKVGEAKLREQLNGMPDTKLAKYVDQGGLIGQVAGQMLEQRKGYADSLQQGNVPTMLEEAQATGKVRPPTAEEQAAAPISPAQTLDDIKASIASAPQEMVGTLASLVQGDIKKDSWLERQIQEARKLTKSNASGEDANAVYPYTFGLTRARLRNLGQQATYSVAAMGAGLAAGAAAAATGVGLPGAVPAAMAGAGVAAYRMDTNNFLHDIRDMLDTVVKKNRGTPLTDDEFVKIAKSYAPLVREHGFAEALPEAVGQVVGMGVNAYIFKNAIKGGLAAIGRSVGAKAFDTGVELGTEGLTQQFQHNTEIDAGTGTGDKRSLTSLDDWKQSLSEVAPEVLLTTGGMGAASHIGGKAYSAAEAKIAPGRVLGREMQEQVDQMGYSQEGVDAEARRNLSPDFVRGAVTPEETRKPAGVLPSVAPVQTDTQPPPDDPLAAPPVSNPIANELAGFNNPEAAPGQSAPQQVQGAENGQGQETEVLIGGRPAREHTPASLSFLMNAHPDQTTRDLAASALAQKQAESRDADPELEDTVRRITGDANASLVSGDTLHSTRGGGSQDAVVRAILDLSGKEPVWYRANGADGFALPQGQPNRVFLNADKADIAPVVTAGHEVFHLVEKEAPDLRDAFRATVDRVSKIDLSTDDGLLAYAQTYAPKQLAEGGGTIDGLLSKLGSGYTRDTLRNEFYNDVFGNRWHEPGFYKALIKELARTDIGLLGKFKAALDLVAQKVSSLRGQNFEADKFLSDIEPVRQEAARVYAAYASRQSHRDRLSKMTPAELLMTSKSHPDEVVRDMADAEVKRREVEAAYQQHARQQPAMAAKEQKEKRQQSGQTFREQEAAKEAEADQKVAQAVRESEQEESRVTALEQALAGAKKDNQALRRQVAKEMKKAAATARGAAQVRQDVLADNEQGQFSPARDDGQTLPTRWPTAAKATPSINDPMLADLATLRETETQFAQAVEALASEPGMRSRAKTLDGKLRFVLDRMVDNLLWLHDQVPADIRTRSKLWYDGANAIANRWADQYDKSKAQAAGILAVLSPQKDWFMNVTMGERVLDVMSTQMDHAFDAKMRGAAFKFLTKEWTKAPEDRKNMAAFQSIKDKTLREAIAGGDLRAAGIWLRAYDEAHHDPRHAVIHPEGDFGENARTATDTETLRAWGDFTTLGKAASIFLDGSPENINDKLGAEHKVRNFYNNIFAPKDERFATIDTHAVAADLLRPLASADKPVADNFGKTGGSKLTGVSGTYPIHLEAYKRAAEARGILPREMQSITWEAVRGLFTEGFKGKKQNLTAISNVWTDVDKGVLTADQAREKILGMAGGIQHPDWWEGQAAGVIGNAKSYAQSRPVFSGNKIIFEVAPDPHNEELTRRWNAMPEDKKAAISFDIAWDTAGKLLGFYNTEHIKGELHTQVGGYLDNTNPSFSLWMNKYTSMVKVQEIAHALGYALNQDSMVIGSPKSFRGGTEMGAVTIQGVSDTNAKAVYDELRAAIRGDNGEALIEGHTTAEGSMVILVPKGTEEAIHHRIVDQLGDRHDVGYGTTFVQWPEKGDNDYGFIGQDKTGGGSTEPSLREYVHQLRDEASAELDRRISAVGFSPDRSDAARDGRAGAGTEGQPGQDIPGYGVATPGSVRVRGVHYSSGERSSLDGRYYGTGARGAEGPRVRAAEDSRIKERIYFYVDSGKGITPEQGVGSIAHAAQLNNLYDLNADTWLQKKLPQGLTGDAVQNAFESAVIDNGFDGYVADFGTQRAAVLLGRHSVPVTRSTDQASVEAPSQGKPARRTDLPMGKMSGAEWKKLEPRATELEDDKSYYRDEVKYSPERFDKIAEAFADRARKALANPRNTQPVLIHSNTPASMQILGWADRKLMVEASELAKIANKPGFETDEKIGNLVLDLARPGAMFWNDKQGSLNILRREDMRGAPALIAVRPGVPMGIDRAHLMVTAHRLENQGALLRKITSGELKPLYLDQANPLIKQAMQTRKYRASTLDLLAPENLHARASVQLDTSSRLLSEADLVKWEQDNWGDAPKFSPARLTEDRIDRLMSQYAYTMDDKKSKAYIAWVRPESYLAATTIPGRERAQLESEKRPLDKDGLRNEYQEIFLLGKFDPENGWWKTTGHEGRHRMMALRDAGITRVPVVFGAHEGERREPIGNLFVTPQRWGNAKAERGFFAANLIPINYENLGKIKTEFGGAAAVQCSPSRAQTETPEFKKWYEGSNLRNADGSPMVLYHGTNKDFSRFGISKTGAMGPGVYLGDDPEVANAYAGGNGANVMPVYARGRYIGNREWSSYVGENGWEKGREKAIKDGVAGVWDQKFESAVLVFDPSNIKSAIGNNGQFDRTNPDIRYSPSRWYFSPLQRAFEQAPDRVFSTAPQIKAWLSSNASKLGVKQDEIQWSGINDWLDLQGKQKVSKDQVIQYLANNGVQVEEVEKDKGGYDEENPTLPEGRDLKVIEADEEYHGRMASRYKYVVIDEAADTTKGWGNSEEDAIADAHSGHPEYWEGNDATQYSQYVLPGGKNYRELLLTLPGGNGEIAHHIAQAKDFIRSKGIDPDEEYGYRNEGDYIDLAEGMGWPRPQAKAYRSSHWTEENILAHVRMNDRTDADGNRVLFIEELQSDWGQAGEKRGFVQEGKVPAGWVVEEVEITPYKKMWAVFDNSGVQVGIYKDTREEAIASATQPVGYVGGIPAAPFVTDTKAWVSLAVKRMIAYAVENGYDKVAFVNGEQSAERYGLSKQVSRIEYAASGGSQKQGRALTVKGLSGSTILSRNAFPEELPDLIGKEAAEKLLASEPVSKGGAVKFHTIEGDGLKVGGEGMKAFYDRIVPQVVSYVLERVGGGKMETVEIDNGKAFSPEVGEVNDIMQQTGFSITPAMREQVSRGLPLFSLARAQIDVDGVLRSTRNSAGKPIAQTEEGLRNFWRWFGDSKVVDANGKPLVVYHGTTSGFSEFSKKGVKPNFSTPQKHIGFFFTDDQSYADRYTSRWGEPKDGANTMLVYLSLKNPKIEPIEKIDEIEDRMKQSDAKAYRADLEAQGYDGLVFEGDTKIGFVREYVAFRPNQIKSAIGNNGQFDPTNPDIRMSLARKVSDAVDSTLGKLDAAVDGLHNLPEQFKYMEARYLALGKVARVDEIINEIRDGFKDVPQADKAAVYAYLTTRGASPSMIGHAEARAMAKRIKDTINYVGDALVARGLLDPAARAHYKDQYLPRMYLKHLMSEQDWKVLGAGKKPTDMGYLKHRKDIAPEIRELVLGEVKDPAFLSASAIGRAMRDVALLDWLGKISQNDNWIYPSVFVPYRGQRVSAFWLKSEADRISRQIPHYEAAAQAKAQQLVDQMRSLADAAIHALPAIQNGAVVIEHTKYKQIPDTNRYGLLRGMLVREEVYNDIMGDSQLVNADPGVFADWLGYGGKGTKLVQAWKFAKVALNPPGQIRNFMSNMVMLQLSGIGLHKLPVLLVQAANEISKNGRHWMIAKKYGVTESTFTAQELHRFKRDLLALEVQAKGMHPLSWLRLAGTHLFDKVGDLYQFTEALGKTIKIIDEMNKGKSEAEAAIEAQKWLFDYSLVNKEIRYLRNAPVGAPFLTYQAKVLPRLLEVATKHPWRFLPWAGLLYGMQAYVASLFGADDDDLKKLKKSLPQWLQDRGHTVFLPFRDADGRLQVADVGYYFPWTFYSQTGGHLWEGNLKKALVDDIFGMMSSPILGAAGALATNYDSFTKRPIYNEADPGSYQAAAIANYAYDLMAPPFVSSHGFASPMGLVDKQYGGKMVQAVSGTTNKFGDPKATEGQALAGLLGFNFYGLDPEHTRATNLQVMTAKVQEAERQLKYRLMDRGLSDEQRGKYVADYQRRMIELGQEAKKYANESEVPEQLRASRPSP